MRLNAFILRAVGIWGPGYDGHEIVSGSQVGCARRVISYFATMLLLFGYVTFILNQGAALVFNSDDLTITINNLCLLSETIAGILKATSMLWCREGLNRCLHRLNALLRHRVVKRRGWAARRVVAKAGRSSYFFTIAFLVLGFTSCSSWFAYPFLKGTELSCWERQRQANHFNGSSVLSPSSSLENARTCPSPPLPAVGWFPFDVTKSPEYMVAYVYQVWAILNLYFSTSTIDTLLGSLIIYLASQLEILALDISEMRNSLSTNELPREWADFQKALPIQDMKVLSEKKYEEYLSDAIDYHQDIIVCAKEIQSLVNVPVLVQFGASMVVICTSLYALAATSGEDHAATVKFGAYSVNMLFQIGIYCWYGNDVMEKSENVVLAAYSCPWYDASKEFRKRILFIMLRTQRTLSLKGGVFYELSRSTYLSLVNASYSFYNLLRSTQ